ncbi:lactonase family protein [Actinomadura yumaensis]|uniref:Lactonase family protein n=2 Tax=Actinomadura TaxID=1988 RepID=A0ABW2CW77_9ACTN
MDERRFWVGTYTREMGGSGRGVYLVERGADGTLGRPVLAAEATTPSYLAAPPGGNVLYAVDEHGDEVVAFRVGEGGALRRIGGRPVPGWPCHLALRPGGGRLLAACYRDGALADLRLGPDGSFDGEPEVHQGEGSGPDPERQEGPHVHAAAFAPDGTVLATDLGADVLRAFRDPGGDGALELVAEVPLPPGCGPRHLVVHPAGQVHVLTELAGTVITLRPGAGGHADLSIVGEAPATAGSAQSGSMGAAIKLGADGRHLYTSTRGADVVTTHLVLDGGAGTRPVADVASGGEWPRDLHVDGAWMHVANQNSGVVATFRLGGDGVPVPAGTPAEIPSPVCVIPA